MSIAISGVLAAVNEALQKTPTAAGEETALMLDIARMELMLGQRGMLGFSSLTNPCGSGCTPMTGYTVTTTVTTPSSIPGDTASQYRLITVRVSGKGDATLTALVANY